jgi:hypothetical protein
MKKEGNDHAAAAITGAGSAADWETSGVDSAGI